MTELLPVSLLIMLVGLVGTVVPGLPGMILIMGGIALFTFGSGFSVVGVLQFAALMVLGLIGMGLNFLGNLIGAQKFGASRIGLLGAVVGLVIGLFTLGPFGIVIGPLIGAVAAELLKGRATRDAVRSGFGVLIGYIFGSLAEVLIALVMIGWFVWSTWGVLTGSPPPRGGVL
jgi:uncharacterized protein YqgC (DUF456 family)